MVANLQTSTKPEIIYPESDGLPMADNTEQFDWIVIIKLGLESLFADNTNVFIAGDLLSKNLGLKPRPRRTAFLDS